MHENVVLLYGVVELANGDIGAVVDFCAQGALVDALHGEKARSFQFSTVARSPVCSRSL